MYGKALDSLLRTALFKSTNGMNFKEMTRAEIEQELAQRASLKYLSYLALQEIMLDFYEDITFLKAYDNDLKLKHKNMINALQRNSTKAYRYFQEHEEGESTIKQFHDFVNLFDGLHKAIDARGNTFFDCLNAVEEVLVRDGLKEKVG